MHTVKCPGCGRNLATAQPVAGSKVRCPACGNVFVATTHATGTAAGAAAHATQRPERPDAPPGEGGGEPAPSRPRPAASPAPATPAPQAPQTPQAPGEVPFARPAVSQPPPPAAAIPRYASPAAPRYPAPPATGSKQFVVGTVLVASLVLIVAGVVVMVKYAGTEYVKFVDDRGRLIFEGRVPHAEAARMREDAKARTEGDMNQPVVPPLARGPIFPSNPPPFSSTSEVGPADANTVEFSPVPELALDERITASWDKIMRLGSTNSGWIVGTVHSTYTVPLELLHLTPQIVDGRKKTILTLPTFTCHWVPGRGKAKYAVEFSGVPEDMIQSVRVSAAVVEAPKNTVVYEADISSYNPREGGIVVAGKVTNLGLKTLAVEKVYIEFFTRDGLRDGEVEAKLEESYGKRIAPGRKVPFQAEYTLKAPDPTGKVNQAVARVVGKEE